MIVVIISLSLLGLYLTAYTLYLSLLLVASLVLEPSAACRASGFLRFAIIVPAHNEEELLGGLLFSIKMQEYPDSYYDIVVIADNCTDGTVLVASRNGAIVRERHDLTAIGKGYALKHGIDSICLDEYDAVLIVDADCTFGPGVLEVFNRCLQAGHRILQSTSAPANPGQSWFTRLSNLSYAVSNEVILKGKRNLGFSILLMGTGMCFSSELLKRYGWTAFSVGEDLEFYGHLLSNGEKIIYAREAEIFHEECSNLRQATSSFASASSAFLKSSSISCFSSFSFVPIR